MVTVLLATERPLCMRSTAMSSGSSGPAPRAKTVWIVLTDLPSWPARPAITDCASSCPPKTTPWSELRLRGAVAVGSDLLERQRLDERSDREHILRVCHLVSGASVSLGDGPPGHDRTTVRSFLTATSKSDTLASGSPGRPRAFRVVAGAAAACPGWIRTTRGTSNRV